MNEIGPTEIELVDKAVSALAEHFDTVHVFVTKYDGATGDTDIYDSGVGNFYARLGHLYDWLNIQRQDSRNIGVEFTSEDDEDDQD